MEPQRLTTYGYFVVRGDHTYDWIFAHEMAHMWFGDLVTLRWWSDLWLNESFADWMANKITDQLYPEFEIGLLNRGEKVEITTLEEAVTSELSGNLVDICPVGALTDRFRVRHLSFGVMILLATACLAMAMVTNALLLIFVLFVLFSAAAVGGCLVRRKKRDKMVKTFHKRTSS